MAEYERTKNPVPDNTPEDWEARAVQWAIDNGLLAGDLKGNLMLHSNMTRAQFFHSNMTRAQFFVILKLRILASALNHDVEPNSRLGLAVLPDPIKKFMVIEHGVAASTTVSQAAPVLSLIAW